MTMTDTCTYTLTMGGLTYKAVLTYGNRSLNDHGNQY
jgi:hypothetical protein